MNRGLHKPMAVRMVDPTAREWDMLETAGRDHMGMTSTDYILECKGDRIDMDFADHAAQLQEEVG